MEWQDRITSKPCIQGTRIMASVVLDNLADGLAAEQIAAEYPPLTPDDVRAAIAYAADLAREEAPRGKTPVVRVGSGR